MFIITDCPYGIIPQQFNGGYQWNCLGWDIQYKFEGKRNARVVGIP
jgi:hypothetical protein